MRGMESYYTATETDVRFAARATAVQVHGLRELTNEQLRALIAHEREQGRAFGFVAEAARTLYELRTGRRA